MIHPELAPSRTRWVVAPLIIVLILAAAWTGFWFYASSTAQATLAQWREQDARLGGQLDVFDSAWTMDHLDLGDGPCWEGWTNLDLLSRHGSLLHPRSLDG